jgi:hypothetical protein
VPSGNNPGEIYWSVIEPHWIPLNEAWDYDIAAFLSSVRKVHVRVCHLYAAHWCQSEVINGGFYQFFHNSTGILAPESLAGFHAIGLHDLATALNKAMKFFGEEHPRERKRRLEQLPEMANTNRAEWDPFIKEDELFYRCLEIEEYRWERAADIYAAVT